MNRHNRLNILQYNVRKSRDMVMESLLRDPGIYDFAIQEPWTNPYSATTHHPAKDRFHLCYPTGDTGGPARVCFFINKRMEQTKWRFEEQTRDICSVVVELSARGQEGTRLVVHNIYNPPRNGRHRGGTLPKARESLERHRTAEQILLGDFNLHHPL